jgi:cellobiose phosphorylase
MGSVDWNDGMNLVGIHGKGESIWLGFFLYEILNQYSQISKLSGDIAFTDLCRMEAEKLRTNLEKHAWDGEWYLRAFFDNGTPLGSKNNQECQIDSIAQSWAVLSEAGNIDLNRKAMDALDKNLVRPGYNLIQLLEPPFDKSDLNPGYIKGYSPGVRENGGQYTHAAIWAIMAFAKMGDSNHAWELMNMINPINHSNSPEAINTYKVEPYVVAADVYSIPPHAGRGGWTWYTGSAAWMYRLIVESLLGLKLEVDKLHINPCIPENWEAFTLHYRYRETHYQITILQLTKETLDIRQEALDKSQISYKEKIVTLDSIEQPDKLIHLVDDRIEHYAEVKIFLKKKY